MVPVNVLILGQIADIFVTCKNNIAGVSGNFLHDDPKKGCFSCTIASDKGRFFPVLKNCLCLVIKQGKSSTYYNGNRQDFKEKIIFLKKYEEICTELTTLIDRKMSIRYN